MGDGLRDALDPRARLMTDTRCTVNRPGRRVGRPRTDVLLEVRDLRTYFHVMDGTVKAVDGVDFSLP